jgi:hypothetical protein
MSQTTGTSRFRSAPSTAKVGGTCISNNSSRPTLPWSSRVLSLATIHHNRKFDKESKKMWKYSASHAFHAVRKARSSFLTSPSSRRQISATAPVVFLRRPFHSGSKNNQPCFQRAFSTNKDIPDNITPTKRSSNWWIRLGWTLLGLVVLDQALQIKQEWEDEGKRQMLKQIQKEADDTHPTDFNESLPTLFKCRLMHIEPSLDGTKMLTRRQQQTSGSTSLQPGDVVDVIEANVGPNQAYHVCRVKSRDSNTTSVLVGWYPVMFLERVE